MSSDLSTLPAIDNQLFGAMPGNSILLLPDAPHFTILAATDDYIRTSGRNRAELVGRSIFEAFPKTPDAAGEESEQTLRHSLEQPLNTKTPYRQPPYRYDITDADGVLGERWWSIINKPVLGENGEVLYIMHTAEDLTSQVKAEQAQKDLGDMQSLHRDLQAAYATLQEQEQTIRASDDQFRVMVNTLPLSIWITDPQGNTEFLNQYWCDYCGEPYATTTVNDIAARHLHPDDAPRVMKAFAEAVQTGQPFEVEQRNRSAAGDYRWFLNSATPYRDPVSGQISKWFGVGIDIHDRKLAEEVLRRSEEELERKVQERTRKLEEQTALLNNILVNSSNGISVTEMVRDEAGNVIDALTILANDAAVQFTGLPKEVYLAKRATELDPNILQSPYGQQCLHTLVTGEPSFSQYFLEVTGKWLELTISKMDNEHLIHIFTDVTPIKEAQLQLERTVEDLKRSNKNLEEFAYAASHDMKEPIRKIGYFADRLKERLEPKLEAEERRYFERLEMGTKRMSSLIDDLLLYSHVSRGMDKKEMVDLNSILALVRDDVELIVAEKGARITIDPLPTIKGQPRQLQQLFENLVANALKYNKPGVAPEIRITCRQLKGSETPQHWKGELGERPYHLIAVEDNGIGFAQEDAERIFNVFTRLHGNAEYSGTGVGLSIVKKVVENHHGRIWAESTPGVGTRFQLLLPA